MGLKLVSLKYDTHQGLFYFPPFWWGWKVTTDVKETTNLVEIALETCKKIQKKVVTTMHKFSPKRRNADTHPALVWNRSLLNMVPTQHNMGLQLDSMKCDTHTNTGLNCVWKSTSCHSSHAWTILLCWSSRTASWLCMGMLTISSKRVLNCLTACNKSHWL